MLFSLCFIGRRKLTLTGMFSLWCTEISPQDSHEYCITLSKTGLRSREKLRVTGLSSTWKFLAMACHSSPALPHTAPVSDSSKLNFVNSMTWALFYEGLCLASGLEHSIFNLLQSLPQDKLALLPWDLQGWSKKGCGEEVVREAHGGPMLWWRNVWAGGSMSSWGMQRTKLPH